MTLSIVLKLCSILIPIDRQSGEISSLEIAGTSRTYTLFGILSEVVYIYI